MKVNITEILKNNKENRDNFFNAINENTKLLEETVGKVLIKGKQDKNKLTKFYKFNFLVDLIEKSNIDNKMPLPNHIINKIIR
jgi:hypothetical protein